MERRSGKEDGGFFNLGGFGSVLAEKLMDAGNLVLAGLVVAQFLYEGEFNWRLALIGWFLWLLCFGFAGWLLYPRRGGA